MIPAEVLALLTAWELGEITGTISLNFAEGILTSYESREHRRILRGQRTGSHTAPVMSRETQPVK